MAQVALAWVARGLGVASVLIGASRSQQLAENIASLDVAVSPEQAARLEAATAAPMMSPYFIFDLPRERIFGGRTVRSWAEQS